MAYWAIIREDEERGGVRMETVRDGVETISESVWYSGVDAAIAASGIAPDGWTEITDEERERDEVGGDVLYESEAWY